MYRIGVVTSTRADYGLLSPIIKKLKGITEFNTDIIVTGMHLEEEYGYTYREIEADGFAISYKIRIQEAGNSCYDMTKTMANVLTSFGELFAKKHYDLLVVLGDRYEMLAVCIAAVNEHIPIAHLYGGDTTEGALDECYRHSITKMSYLHFTSTKIARERVIRMGEDPERVFNVGAVGIENALKCELLSKHELEQELGFSLGKKYAVVTFHPVTQEVNTAGEQINSLIEALNTLKDYHFLITKSNSDAGSRLINDCLEKFASDNKNVHLVTSLGMKKYLSALKYADFAIGNSSSGLMEVPCFGIPTINIGDRQKGRVQGNTIVNCLPNTQEIIDAVNRACNNEFVEQCKKCDNPYGDGKTSDKVVEVICDYLTNGKIEIKKMFYNGE